jgi:PAS domain S-box-containing protein
MLNTQLLRERIGDKIYYNSPDGIFIANSTGRYIDVNPSACEITGYTFEELTSMSLFDILHPDSKDEVFNVFVSLASKGKTSNEFKYIKKDGSIYYMQVDAVKFDDDTYLGFCKDTTKRKLNEEACTELTIRKKLEDELVKQKRQLEIKNEELKAIMESMSDGLFMLGKDYEFTFLNREGHDFFYKPENKKRGDSFTHTKYYDMQGKELLVEEMVGSRVLKGEKIKNCRIKAARPDKTLYFSMSGNPIYSEYGEIDAAIICCRDITEQVENEKLIYQQSEQLEAIIENMVDGFCQIDRNNNCIKVNKAYRKLMESVTISEFEQTPKIGQILYDENGDVLYDKDIPSNKLLSGESVYQQRVMSKKNNINYYFDITGTPFFDDNRNFLYGILTSHDVTDRVQKENTIRLQQEQLLKAEKEKNEALIIAIEMKDEFLSIISHEFKTPLTVINSAIQTMELICKDELSAKGKDFLKKIKQNAFRQLRLVNNLLDITRANAGQIKIHKSSVNIVSYTKSIVDSVNIYALQKDLEIKFIATIKKKFMYLDEEKYERIILNLISNAIKFTPKGESIEVRLSMKERRKKSNICIEVIDTGVGIPKDKQSLIFERFGQVDSSLTRQAEGTGIGLSLVKKFVEAHWGEIKVESEVGRGSTFTILLPIFKECKKTEIIQLPEPHDNRLIQSAEIEFSDIYF